MAWFVAPSLNTLLGEFNTMAPGRSKAADGSIGDASHSARRSDHNPDYSAGGVVRARDFTHDPPELDIHKEVRKPDILHDPRTKYIISNDRIMAYYAVGGYPPYAERPYGGSNPHRQHAHQSIKPGRVYEFDTTSWYGTTQEEKLDAETKAKFEEIDRDFAEIKAALGDDYGKSIAAALFKVRRDQNGNVVKGSDGKPVYDEHLNVLEAKLDELLLRLT